MPLSRKETAWKKSRKFGEVKGGRRWPKVTDKILRRYHSLQKPEAGAELPIFIRDNPGRDFYFPIDESGIRQQIARLPEDDTAHLTHIWLRRIEKRAYGGREFFQGMYIRGSGVHLIILNPFPKDLKMLFSERKPVKRVLNLYAAWTTELDFDNEKGFWFLKWTEEAIRDYYLNSLFLHEIGHLADWPRSKAATRKSEHFADDYAVRWRDINGSE